MKIDKDFVLKYGGRTFTAKEIESIKISSGWLSMRGVEVDGMRVQLETQLKDVEFLSLPCDQKINVDKARHWNICDGDFISKKIDCCLEDIKEALSEAIKTLKEEQRCNIEMSIDGELFGKLIKKYNQDQDRRSGGD